MAVANTDEFDVNCAYDLNIDVALFMTHRVCGWTSDRVSQLNVSELLDLVDGHECK